jgi:hypothetical protein
VTLNLALVFFILRISQTEMPLRSLLIFFPELSYAAVVVTTIGIGWSAYFTVM